MNDDKPIVYVVDDDGEVREALDMLLRSAGYEPRCFRCVDEFLGCPRADGPSCLVLDVRMPGQSGLDLQDNLHKRGDLIPIVFLTGHGDVPMSVRAIKAGATEFLLKPFREQDFLDAVYAAISRDLARRRQSSQQEDLRRCFAALTQRERQVLLLVSDGLPNKVIARQLGLQEITIKVHRARAAQKIKATSFADVISKVNRINAIIGADSVDAS